MTGGEIIKLIKEMNLEDEEIYINNGFTDSGEFMIFNRIKDIKKSDEWNGNRYYIEEE